jgi:hypothetical protein
MQMSQTQDIIGYGSLGLGQQQNYSYVTLTPGLSILLIHEVDHTFIRGVDSKMDVNPLQALHTQCRTDYGPKWPVPLN